MSTNRGFTLVEVLVALALMVTLGGAILSLVVCGQSIARTQPEAADLQQRARVAIQAIRQDLALAGAGLDRGPLAGALSQFFPAMTPSIDGGLTIWYVAGRDAQAALAAPAGPGATEVALASAGVCPTSEQACAFRASTSAILFTAAGCHAVVRIDRADLSALQLHGPLTGCAFAAGSAVAQGEVRTFRVDPMAHQLIRRDEATGLSLPVLDGVDSMQVEYFAAASADAAPVDPSLDPLRIHRARITLRLSVPNTAPAAPVLVVSFDVAPRNLQGG
ncbi:MAG TPA: type II secretion system protein [Vicinamibacterales bacterium]|jgi:prepilin-type N-terminal cleavage/methylation domain-containing protein|nr:type II secretion system protein [Vicinamibacterales bacterium]